MGGDLQYRIDEWCRARQMYGCPTGWVLSETRRELSIAMGCPCIICVVPVTHERFDYIELRYELIGYPLALPRMWSAFGRTGVIQ